MAKIQEEIIIIKVSKLVKDSDAEQPVVGQEIVTGLEAVVQQLVTGDAVVVEVIKE
jgi:hypothetical protein